MWKKVAFPGPYTRGFVLPSMPEPGGCGGVETGHPVPSTSILSSTKLGIVLCALTQFGLGGVACGMTGKTLLNRNTPSPPPMANGLRAHLTAPFFGVLLPVVL